LPNKLLNRIEQKDRSRRRIGQGYVGLPLALVFRRPASPSPVLDIDAAKVRGNRRGESFIKHIGPERVSKAVRSGRYNATTNFDRLANATPS